MPLHISDPSVTPQSLKDVSQSYLIFYSSVVDGRLWCPDCRAIESLVEQTFSASSDSPSALIVYVGDRPTWKSPSNIFRGDPWHVQSVPTIIRLHDGKEVARIVDNEIAGKLSDFVRS